MIHSLKLNDYRGFPEFAMRGLGRINLLVGRNNTGKTTLLEALNLFWSASDLSPLWQTLARRGEQATPENIPGRPVQPEVEVGHLFTGHQINFGSEFSIAAENDGPSRSVTYQILEPKPQDNLQLFSMLTQQDPGGVGMALKISGTPKISVPILPLTRRGALRNDVYNQAVNIVRGAKSAIPPIEFISTESLNFTAVQQMWNDVSLKPEEELVLRALRFIDQKIERIAPILSQIYWGITGRGGFVVRRQGEERVPIGSFGDGIWRIFSLAVALSKTKNGMLLIDEVDTGLHYTVMTEMWRFAFEVAKDFNIQIFATTHSYDCIHSLAAVCRDMPDSEGQITIHRIEAEKKESILFTAKQIQSAAEREIEIR